VTSRRHPLVDAVLPLAAAIGAEIVDSTDYEESDIPLMWEGAVVGAVRLDLTRTVDGMIQQVVGELGSPLSELSREDKQRAIGLLDGRGAFILRKSVDTVAEAMGVSRITIYAYLNATRDDETVAAPEPSVGDEA
jgi:hypothetical protein